MTEGIRTEYEVHQLLPLYPALVIGDVFSVEQLVGWGVFAQTVL